MTSSLIDLRRRTPSSSWYWIAAIVAVLGVMAALVWGAMGTSNVLGRVDNFDRTAIPGAMTVSVTDPGTMVVYYESPAESADHRQAILVLVRAWRPDLLTRPGVGPIVAATVLCAWSHAGRCRSDAAFAMLGGAAPIPASSGQTVRVRLNRSGTASSTRPCTPWS